MFFRTLLETRLGQPIRSITGMGGGDINQVFLVESGKDSYVLKRNSRDSFPKMFEKEAKGLRILADAGFRTPRVAQVFEEETHQYLLMERIPEERSGRVLWKRFGHQLASLHRTTDDHFGLDHDNYIGSLPQKNGQTRSWAEFFVENRILPLARESRDRNLMSNGLMKDVEGLLFKWPELVPAEKPSLLHGDLWSGNLLCGTGQEPVLIDPAVYFGHREMDLAMTAMFGGFDAAYLEVYNEAFPLETGWETRTGLHNLYPNLVHLLLFGSSYLNRIASVVRRYS
jgi:fructosamine-3-kinase